MCGTPASGSAPGEVKRCVPNIGNRPYSSLCRLSNRGRAQSGLTTVAPTECRSKRAMSACQSRTSVKSRVQKPTLPLPVAYRLLKSLKKPACESLATKRS